MEFHTSVRDLKEYLKKLGRGGEDFDVGLLDDGGLVAVGDADDGCTVAFRLAQGVHRDQ